MPRSARGGEEGSCRWTIRGRWRRTGRSCRGLWRSGSSRNERSSTTTKMHGDGRRSGGCEAVAPPHCSPPLGRCPPRPCRSVTRYTHPMLEATSITAAPAAVSLFSNCGAGDVGFGATGLRFRVMAKLVEGRLDSDLADHGVPRRRKRAFLTFVRRASPAAELLPMDPGMHDRAASGRCAGGEVRAVTMRASALLSWRADRCIDENKVPTSRDIGRVDAAAVRHAAHERRRGPRGT